MSATLPAQSMNPTSSDLVQFLLDRLDDDDRETARFPSGATVPVSAVAMCSPDRLRAEIAAKRRVIDDLRHLLSLRDVPSEKSVRDAASQALRALAAPYTGHEHYRAEWRAPKRR